MANTKSAKKALRSSAKKNTVNNSRKSRIRTFAKKVVDSIKSGNKEKALADFKNFESEIMKGVNKKVLKLNNASRNVARVSKQIAKMKS